MGKLIDFNKYILKKEIEEFEKDLNDDQSDLYVEYNKYLSHKDKITYTDNEWEPM